MTTTYLLDTKKNQLLWEGQGQEIAMELIDFCDSHPQEGTTKEEMIELCKRLTSHEEYQVVEQGTELNYLLNELTGQEPLMLGLTF